jgi:acyl dehydratase
LSDPVARNGPVAWNDTPADVEWNEWGPAVRVRVDPAPVALFARAVKDTSPVYRSENAARAAGFAQVPVPPTFTFVMTDSGAFPDLQPPGGTGSMYAA